VRGSLRSRILFGAVLWTVGFFGGAVLLSTAIMIRHPRYPVILHASALFHGGIVLAVVVGLCMLGGFWYVRSGLSPLDRLRERLLSVRTGHERRVEGHYPAEVQPLVNDLNALLENRERLVARALAKAGDLAHGLKTPLAVLSQEGERAGATGHSELAATIGQQVDRMRRQIEYHLAQARAASGTTTGARCSVVISAEALCRTLLRLHADRGVAIQLDVAPEHVVRIQREDLDEMLGNLLDNAFKWARSCVTIRSSELDTDVVVSVDDDGPGIAASMREAVLQRGVRADEAAPGSGLGLAIVRDLAELYGGSISLASSPDGGVRARLQLPGFAAAPQESAIR
jgi:signal transduction histidine kinase